MPLRCVSSWDSVTWRYAGQHRAAQFGQRLAKRSAPVENALFGKRSAQRGGHRLGFGTQMKLILQRYLCWAAPLADPRCARGDNLAVLRHGRCECGNVML